MYEAARSISRQKYNFGCIILQFDGSQFDPCLFSTCNQFELYHFQFAITPGIFSISDFIVETKLITSKK